MTTVVAPMGYGKTTAVNWYLSERARTDAAKIIRISVYSDNLVIFWKSVQDAFTRAGFDFLRDYPAPQVRTLLQARREAFPALAGEELLSGMLHPRLGRTLCHACGLGTQPLASVSDAALDALVNAIKYFSLPVTGVSGFESAQVTAGGVRTAEFRADTLESRLAPGVFACGEVLDIDGDCGGYNLQWAWSSGYVAGKLGKR